MPDLIRQKDDYTISTRKEDLDVAVIHHYLSTQAYWSRGILRATVERAIEHSLNFGLYFQKRQIGYARIVSDFATVAYLGDVFILEAFRGRGLATWLIQTVMAHPGLQGLRRWILLTQDAHEFYRKVGWTPIANPDRWMEVHDREVYEPINHKD